MFLAFNTVILSAISVIFGGIFITHYFCGLLCKLMLVRCLLCHTACISVFFLSWCSVGSPTGFIRSFTSGIRVRCVLVMAFRIGRRNGIRRRHAVPQQRPAAAQYHRTFVVKFVHF